MSETRGQDLARRLRAAIDQQKDEARRAEEERKRRLDALRAERTALLSDLAAFAKAVGHFDVTSKQDVVIWRFEGKVVRFEAEGDADRVRVTGDGIERDTQIFRHETLSKWTLSEHTKGGMEEQKILFDRGLEHLVATAMGISAEGGAAVEPADEETPKRTL